MLLGVGIQDTLWKYSQTCGSGVHLVDYLQWYLGSIGSDSYMVYVFSSTWYHRKIGRYVFSSCLVAWGEVFLILPPSRNILKCVLYILVSRVLWVVLGRSSVWVLPGMCFFHNFNNTGPRNFKCFSGADYVEVSK